MQTIEVLDTEIAGGLKEIINGYHKRRVFLTGRQSAWIYEYLKDSDADESFLDLNENSKVELKNDNVQSFNTRWNETIIAMQK